MVIPAEPVFRDSGFREFRRYPAPEVQGSQSSGCAHGNGSTSKVQALLLMWCGWVLILECYSVHSWKIQVVLALAVKGTAY